MELLRKTDTSSSLVCLALTLVLIMGVESTRGEARKPKRTVGILTLKAKPLSKMIAKQYEDEFSKISENFEEVIQNSSYVAEGYVKWLENVNLKTVALDINSDDKTLFEEMEKLDGLLLTGGRQQFYDQVVREKRNLSQNDQSYDPRQGLLFSEKIPDEYLKKVEAIVKKAKEINKEKRRYPIWSTCLGFEAMLVTESKYTLVRHEVDNELHGTRPIDIYNYNTRSIRFFSTDEQKAFETQNLFYFNHKYGLLFKEFQKNEFLREKVNGVASITKDDKNILVWFEYKNFPFIGSQFHPEKFEGLSEADLKGAHQSEHDVNHKLALLFKTLLEVNSNYLRDVSNDEDFEAEENDAHFDLYNIGMYNHISLYVRNDENK
jgi:hypothetical protein